jgi:hypothetical protein
MKPKAETMRRRCIGLITLLPPPPLLLLPPQPLLLLPPQPLLVLSAAQHHHREQIKTFETPMSADVECKMSSGPIIGTFVYIALGSLAMCLPPPSLPFARVSPCAPCRTSCSACGAPERRLPSQLYGVGSDVLGQVRHNSREEGKPPAVRHVCRPRHGACPPPPSCHFVLLVVKVNVFSVSRLTPHVTGPDVANLDLRVRDTTPSHTLIM